MLCLVRSMKLDQYAPRFYIAGATDKFSLEKAEKVEAELLKDFMVRICKTFLNLGFRSFVVSTSKIDTERTIVTLNV